VTDASDYTIPVHGEQRGLHHVAIEVRQDLIGDEAGQLGWAALFARLLPQAYEQLVAIPQAEMGDHARGLTQPPSFGGPHVIDEGVGNPAA